MWPRILTRTTGAASVDGASHTLFCWLVGAFLLTLLPHVLQLPGWLTFAILAAMFVRCLAEWKHWPLPTTTSTGVVALCLLGGIYLQFHTVLGRDAGTPFMAGLLTIKFYELRGTRDITLIVFSSFFVVMSALLFSQAIELFVYCLIMMWLLTGILLRTYLGDRADDTLLRMLRGSSILFLQALPLVLLLFFFLPRYSGRFSLRLDDAVTGLSDHVEPGSIARLAADDSPAMRVSFAGSTVPMPESMYWRAIVLWYFDGRAWTREAPTARGEAALADLPIRAKQPFVSGDLVEQSIVLWPHGQRWLPALDRPVEAAMERDTVKAISETLAGNILVLSGHALVDYKRQYQVTSSVLPVEDTSSPDMLEREREAGVELPPKIDVRVKALADRLYAANHATTMAYVRSILHYFREQNFAMTTEPGTLNQDDPVADFLFRVKKGYCEHYASAFGELMRLENVPTRMVVGYHGGEFDPYGANGGFYLVSQSNAHAWDEVWVEEKHQWKRVDPASIISTGTSAALAANEGISPDDDLAFRLADHRFTLLPAASLPDWLRNGLRDLQMRRQEIEAQWDDWVFSYDPGTQDRMARALGLGGYAKWVLLAGCLLLIGLAGGIALLVLTRSKPLSPVERFYARLCRRMAQKGAPREPWEGPLAYTERLAGRFPQQKKPLEEAGWIVAEHRYGAGAKEPPTRLDSLLAAASEKS
jgi:transglutaminase-like putative cysteine protease